MEKAARLYGMNESIARIYGTLYFNEEMTLDQLSEETGYAKSTVSRVTKKLERFYMVESRKKPGEGRTKFYTAEEDLEEPFKRLLENEVSQEIEIMLDALEEAEEELEEKGDEKGLEKVRNLKDSYTKFDRFISLLSSLPDGKIFQRLQERLSQVDPRK